MYAHTHPRPFTQSIKFLLHQQRYLELLEAQQTKKALSVLRDRLAPLNHGSEKLHQLSSLVMCSTPEELRARAQWDGTGAASRRKLLQDIESEWRFLGALHCELN